MDRDHSVFVFIFSLVIILGSFVGGHIMGRTQKQNTIVEECHTNGMYLDRNLFMVCQVSTPKVVPKPPTL
jgi:hypothetical protein